MAAYDTTQNGGSDAFAAKLSTTGALLTYATYVGGTGDDFGLGIAIDNTGTPISPATPVRASGRPLRQRHRVARWIRRLPCQTIGAATLRRQYRRQRNHFGYGIAVDNAGDAYVAGNTFSSGWATGSAYDSSQNGGSDASSSNFRAWSIRLSFQATPTVMARSISRTRSSWHRTTAAPAKPDAGRRQRRWKRRFSGPGADLAKLREERADNRHAGSRAGYFIARHRRSNRNKACGKAHTFQHAETHDRGCLEGMTSIAFLPARAIIGRGRIRRQCGQRDQRNSQALQNDRGRTFCAQTLESRLMLTVSPQAAAAQFLNTSSGRLRAEPGTMGGPIDQVRLQRAGDQYRLHQHRPRAGTCFRRRNRLRSRVRRNPRLHVQPTCPPIRQTC